MSYLDYFKEISMVPRASGDMERISKYCEDFAKAKGLEYIRDKFNNVIIYKKATVGRENDKGVIIQAHLDMVAEKTPESNHDFSRDGLKLIEKDGYLTADGTTLGADDGIGVAYALEVLGSDTISHPDLTVVFTVDEEIGLNGMRDIDKSLIKGDYIINIDNDIDGTIFAGSAGGRTLECNIPVVRENIDIQSGKGMEHVTIKVSGLKGGHSGAEIDKERANANVIIGRVLYMLKSKVSVQLVNINGGSKDNAIPRECTADILIDKTELNNVKALVKDMEEKLKSEFAHKDDGIKVDITYEEGNKNTIMAIDKESTDRVVNFMFLVPDGVFKKTFEPMYMVETSSNMGIINSLEKSVYITISVRSNLGSGKDYLTDKIAGILKMTGGTYEMKGDYPQWEYKADSKLQQTFVKVYKELTGKELKREAIHAGLECGYLSTYNPNWDIISMGPAIYDIHTTEETMDLKSAEETFELLMMVLKDIR
ncbi:MAG: aminoacyl-histidine dipeptidase [Lachnospiraceae bacterium]|nr:aminoacyl-histidine dipeptidase [Lachnospiraceae bacterium]